MGFSDCFNYVLYDNPISQGVTSATKIVLQPILKSANGLNSTPPPVQIITKTEPLWILAREAGGPFVKLAGLSGASAVALAAYGSHKKYPKDNAAELKTIHENANKIHFIHTLALLGVPLTKSPKITGSLFILGTFLFSGACYYHSITGENKFGKFAPVGGTVLIFAWLSIVI